MRCDYYGLDVIFLFKQKTAYEMRISDWSSDVCSSDLKSWSHVDRGLPSRDVIAFAAHSAVPDTVYAVVAEQGIYRSEDGGAGWRMMDKGPEAEIQRIIHSNLEGSMQSGWLFAATDRGVYRSMDCFCRSEEHTYELQ